MVYQAEQGFIKNKEFLGNGSRNGFRNRSGNRIGNRLKNRLKQTRQSAFTCHFYSKLEENDKELRMFF
jgi:hypothetical protein